MFFSFRKVRLFLSKALIVLQINKIVFSSIDFTRDCGKLIAKSISNDGKLTLNKCKMTKPGYEAFRAELGDKQVIKC